jgi:hypothetical protein
MIKYLIGRWGEYDFDRQRLRFFDTRPTGFSELLQIDDRQRSTAEFSVLGHLKGRPEEHDCDRERFMADVRVDITDITSKMFRFETVKSRFSITWLQFGYSYILYFTGRIGEEL